MRSPKSGPRPNGFTQLAVGGAQFRNRSARLCRIGCHEGHAGGGHGVIGLVRSEDSAGKLRELGADPLRRLDEPTSQEEFNSEKHNARECGVRCR